ncbi:MAG: chemotaxis protein CheW [Glaciecola sp.]
MTNKLRSQGSQTQNTQPRQSQVIQQERKLANGYVGKSGAKTALLDYFADLTTHDQPIETPLNASTLQLQTTQQLLDKAHQLSILMEVDEHTEVKSTKLADNQTETQNSLQEKSANAEIDYIEATRDTSVSLNAFLESQFQVLLCEVAGVTLALPLVELGGIHKVTKITPIVGKPKWFLGVLVKGEQKYQCIDTAMWIMPERTIDRTSDDTEYKFAVQLGKTPFVLCCDKISTTITLNKDEVKWRDNSQNRPWLAGLLKEKMCALVDGAKMVQDVLEKA